MIGIRGLLEQLVEVVSENSRGTVAKGAGPAGGHLSSTRAGVDVCRALLQRREGCQLRIVRVAAKLVQFTETNKILISILKQKLKNID